MLCIVKDMSGVQSDQPKKTYAKRKPSTSAKKKTNDKKLKSEPTADADTKAASADTTKEKEPVDTAAAATTETTSESAFTRSYNNLNRLVDKFIHHDNAGTLTDEIVRSTLKDGMFVDALIISLFSATYLLVSGFGMQDPDAIINELSKPEATIYDTKDELVATVEKESDPVGGEDDGVIEIGDDVDELEGLGLAIAAAVAATEKEQKSTPADESQHKAVVKAGDEPSKPHSKVMCAAAKEISAILDKYYKLAEAECLLCANSVGRLTDSILNGSDLMQDYG